LLSLAAQADAVIESFSPRVMANFGLTYPTLAGTNLGLVMLSIPAFGFDGPWAQYVSYGSGLELATGLARYDENGRPHAAPVPYLDYLSGAYGATGVLAALIARDRDGAGCHLEVAQREVACQLLSARFSQDLDHQAHSEQFPGSATLSRIANDPHLAARGLFASSDAEAASCHHLARLPWRLHGIEPTEECAAPRFGADSRRVLRDVADLDHRRIDELIDAGVVVGTAA
jgi:crotonobetainyl-CoA:carnitine CoA-transferase CaiB-like acyl-CoA transferase